MAQTDSILPAALNSIKQQIAGAIQRSADNRFASEAAAPLNLGRTLTLWGIKPEALYALMQGADPGQVGDWARSMERWHHQIRFDTESRAFARSKASPTNPAEIALRKLSMSSKAEKIDGAIEWVERELQNDPAKYGLQAPYDPIVRLLEIPSRRVTALLLLDEPHHDTHVLVVEALPGSESLRPGSLLDSVEFLKRLAAQPFPRGIA